ncbi:hypothetical protein CYLTODRAFT_491746 [Cylindrobasidium torrendii FP15055 ss-10]|uniref:Mid2 domain-containing protein n=1 Tax=Cylindrobasidium torrendii FP15055 ss-10 TaxID=1314674 RepID=A0A0D7B7A7_9AGAR|nr:hypothetical protein CYLTODRAFT_491746 [Cylindrobasidium torrendii FP15055 ss-10]
MHSSYYLSIHDNANGVVALRSPQDDSCTGSSCNSGDGPILGTPSASTPSSTPTLTSSHGSSGPPIGAIVGGIMGGIVLLVLIASLVFLWRRRRCRIAPSTEFLRSEKKLGRFTSRKRHSTFRQIETPPLSSPPMSVVNPLDVMMRNSTGDLTTTRNLEPPPALHHHRSISSVDEDLSSTALMHGHEPV